MTLHILGELVQGTSEWADARRGIVTASTVGRLLTLGAPDASGSPCPVCAVESGPCMAVSRKTPTPMRTFHADRLDAASDLPPVVKVANNETSRALTATLVAERIAGWTDPSFMNDDMMRGVLHEPIARDKYAEINGVAVAEIGFMVRDDWGFPIGASPDGLVGESGGLEIKCPRSKSHIATVLADEVPAIYMPQVQASLLVSGRKWWDYVSFCAGLPLYTKRVYPDAAWQEAIVQAVADFESASADRIEAFARKAADLPGTDRIYDDLMVA